MYIKVIFKRFEGIKVEFYFVFLMVGGLIKNIKNL